MKKSLLVVAVFAAILFAGCKQNSDSGSKGGFKFTLPEPVGENPFAGKKFFDSIDENKIIFDAENRTFTNNGITKYKYSYNTDKKLLYVECDSADIYELSSGIFDLKGLKTKEEIFKFCNDYINNLTDDQLYSFIQDSIGDFEEEEKDELLELLGYSSFEWENEQFKEKILELFLDEIKETFLEFLLVCDRRMSAKGIYSYEISGSNLILIPFFDREIKLPEVVNVFNIDFASFLIDFKTVDMGKDDFYCVRLTHTKDIYDPYVYIYASQEDYNKHNYSEYKIENIKDSEIIVTDKDGNSKTFTYTSEYDETTFTTTVTITFDDGKKAKASGIRDEDSFVFELEN